MMAFYTRLFLKRKEGSNEKTAEDFDGALEQELINYFQQMDIIQKQ